jgi:two-component system cell cycle sensor histidine kinase/response regulator CckA
MRFVASVELPFPGASNARSVLALNMPVSLVVDDEPAVRKYVSTILRREKFETLEAGDGTHALRLVQELDGDVDLIVSDIQMPNGDGLSLAQAVKSSFPAVPVILVSGNAGPDSGFEFVQKPFLPSTLIKAVRRLLARKTEPMSSRSNGS